MGTIRSAFLFAVIWGAACSSQAIIPHVKVIYDVSGDVTCSKLPGGSIKEEWKAELLSRQPEFVRLWETEGLGAFKIG
jgi:hypothetical protein